jgi:hypothetical protein
VAHGGPQRAGWAKDIGGAGGTAPGNAFLPSKRWFDDEVGDGFRRRVSTAATTLTRPGDTWATRWASWWRFREAVDATGYSGPVEVEVFHADAWARPGREVLDAAIAGYRQQVM